MADKSPFAGIEQGVRTYTGATSAGMEQYTGPAPSKDNSSGGAVSDFFKFFGTASTQIGKLGVKATVGLSKFIGRAASETVLGVYDFGDAIGKTLTGQYTRDLANTNKANEDAARLFAETTRAYRAGKASKAAYDQALKEYTETLSGSNKTIQKTMRAVDKTDFLQDAAHTLGAVLSFGSYTKIGDAVAGSRYATPAVLGGSKTGPVFEAANKLDDLVTKIPSMRVLLANHGAQGIERGVINQSTRDALAAVLIKQPFVYHSTIDDVGDIARDMADGKYGKAAARAGFITTLAMAGGVFGEWMSGVKKFTGASKKALFGVGSTMDELGKVLKESDATAMHQLLEGLQTGVYKNGAKLPRAEREAWNYLKKLSPQEVEDTLKLFNESMLQATKDDVFEVVARIAADNQGRLGRSIGDVSAAEWVAQNFKYQRAAQRLNELVSSGKIKSIDPQDARKVALAVFDSKSKAQFLKSMEKTESAFERMQALNELINSGKAPHWLQNKDMEGAIVKIVKDSETYEQLAKKVNNMTAGIALKDIPKKIAKEFAQEGYVITKPFRRESPFVTLKEARNLTTSFDNSLNWDPAFAPNKALRTVGGRLRKMGLSPEETSQVAYQQLKGNIDTAFKDINIGLDSEATLRSLRNFAEKKKAVTDLRMLRKSEVMQALGVDGAQAKQVMEAIHQAHLQIPLQLRGLADRIIDKMYKYTPYYKYQARIQSAGRYAYNPFFKLQENVETELLAQMGAHGKGLSFPLLDDMGARLFPNYYNKLDDAVGELTNARLFTGTFYGEAADDVVLGRITANITKSQKRSLAGLALKIADKKGMPLKELLAKEPDIIEDALRIIVQYPKKGAINSPLVKMMNLAVFPARYNMKVAGMVAQELAKVPPTVQVAMLTSMMDFPGWLRTDEGITWQQEHREAIQLMNWLTPIGSLNAIAKAATGNIDSVAELGMLGGLPFGWLGQVLDSQGIIRMNTPYVDIKTGSVYSRELPADAKGRVYLATIDLLNQLFTYPGRTIGLPGKRGLLRDISGNLVGIQRGVNTDFIDQEPYLTNKQIQLIERIRKEKLDAGEPDLTINYYTLPSFMSIPMDQQGLELLPKSQRPKKGKSSKPKTLPDTSLLGL